MPSRQFAHLREKSLNTLRGAIPSACPLRVVDAGERGFHAITLDGMTGMTGRYQVVFAYVQGFVDCWKRVRPSEPHTIPKEGS